MKISLKKFGVIAIGSALVLAAAVVVFSQQPQGPPPGAPGPPPGAGFRHGPVGPGGPHPGFGAFGPFGHELNLTEDQKAATQKIHESFRESNRALHEQMRTLRESQPDPMTTAFDEAAVRSAAEARSKIQVELEVSHARMMSQMMSVLTADQKAKLAERHQQMKHMGPHPPRPPRPNDQPF